MLVSALSGLQGKWRIEAINFKAIELQSLVFIEWLKTSCMDYIYWFGATAQWNLWTNYLKSEFVTKMASLTCQSFTERSHMRIQY